LYSSFKESFFYYIIIKILKREIENPGGKESYNIPTFLVTIFS
jgi:hypothetical protein